MHKVKLFWRVKYMILFLAIASCLGASVTFSEDGNEKEEDRAWIAYCGRDESDSDIPRTVVAGGLEWQTYNLNVSYFQNGDPIPRARTEEEWADALGEENPACCYYDNDSSFGQRYGKLYNRHAVEDSRFGLVRMAITYA